MQLAAQRMISQNSREHYRCVTSLSPNTIIYCGIRSHEGVKGTRQRVIVTSDAKCWVWCSIPEVYNVEKQKENAWNEGWSLIVRDLCEDFDMLTIISFKKI